jgi:hypothetical protein
MNRSKSPPALEQISIFLENSPGRLLEITSVFGNAGVNLRALSLAGMSGFGVLRLIVSDLHHARNIAMEQQWPARVDKVIAVRIPDLPGSLANLLTCLGDARIDVDYMYAFTGFSPTEAVMIFGFKDVEEAAKALLGCNASLISTAEFEALEIAEN